MTAVAVILGLVALACALIAGDIAIVAYAVHAHHHTTAGIFGAAAGAFFLDAVVIFLTALLAEG